MAKSHLLQTVCAVALLAAAPAFAQTNMPTGATGPGGAPNDPTGVTAPEQPPVATHHRAMHAMHARNNLPGDAAIDRLNQQSYDAARNGQTFAPAGTTTNQ